MPRQWKPTDAELAAMSDEVLRYAARERRSIAFTLNLRDARVLAARDLEVL